ncbi:MAG: hypothetical protein AB8G15_04475 [Saprospiraceae bacterium]
MDLQKAWKAHQDENFSQPKINKDMILQAIQQDSNSTMDKLKTNLFLKLMWVVLFTVSTLLFMLFNLDRTELLLILLFPLIYFLTGLIVLGLQYRKLSANMDFSKEPLTFMKNFDRALHRALQFETVSGLIFYPMAAITGFCIARHFKGVSLMEVFQDADALKMMLVAILILTPLAHFGAKAMNEKAFGSTIKCLKENIRKLDELK